MWDCRIPGMSTRTRTSPQQTEVLHLDVAMVASFQFVRVMIALLVVDMINYLMQRPKGRGARSP